MGMWGTIASTALSVGGSLLSGSSQAKTQRYNAEMARRQGLDEMDAAVAQSEKIRNAARKQVGSAKAQAAANGVAVDSGTTVDIVDQINQDSEEDAYMTLLTGKRRMRASNDQASIYNKQASNTGISSLINAGSSVLSGGKKLGWW